MRRHEGVSSTTATWSSATDRPGPLGRSARAAHLRVPHALGRHGPARPRQQRHLPRLRRRGPRGVPRGAAWPGAGDPPPGRVRRAAGLPPAAVLVDSWFTDLADGAWRSPTRCTTHPTRPTGSARSTCAPRACWPRRSPRPAHRRCPRPDGAPTTAGARRRRAERRRRRLPAHGAARRRRRARPASATSRSSSSSRKRGSSS